MSNKKAKKLRKEIKIEAKKQYDELHKYCINTGFVHRFNLAWRILFPKRRKK